MPTPALGWRIWLASGAMMLCSWLSYTDRQILAVLSPIILADTGLSAERYAQVVSAFSIAYMIANPLWGAVLDYVGLRIGMLIAVAVWSAASVSHAFIPQTALTGPSSVPPTAAAAFLGFAAARILLGLGEGATFPGGLRTVTDSLPPNRQSRGLALSFSGGSLGAILAPVMVVPIALRFGWRSAFLLTGVLGALWLVFWSMLARPPYLPQRERPPTRMVWPNPRERRFWALVSSYSLGCFALGPILYLSPLYLNRVLGLSPAQLGRVLWIPPLGWEVGYFFWGWIADRFAPPGSRPVGLFLLLAALSLPQAAIPAIHSIAPALAMFFWAMFIAGGFVVLCMRDGIRAYSREQSALVAGIASGAWSALVALAMPLLGRWFDQQRYGETFWWIAASPVAAVTLWLWFSREGARPPKRVD